MNDAIIHRGPDDDGVWSEDGFGFGMRRLSIIDLSGGHQPIWDDTFDLGVVFNGEVYNYRSLRDQLDKIEKIHWKTQSDTEVVLRSLSLLGIDAISKWNGMFAVAAWNPKQKELLLVRDRMGVKPVYYYWDGRTFLFASEIKAILASGLVDRRVNLQSVWDYLTYRYVPGPDSIWHGIRKLQPGHVLRFRPGSNPVEEQYWTSPVIAETGSGSRDSSDREFKELFLESVELRLVASDVPVGVFLSGGLDSSAIAAAAVELGHKNFHTFSVGFKQGGVFSELEYAREMARHVGSKHHEVVVDQDSFLQLLPEVVYASDEPLADLTLVPLLALSRAAREDVKVVLSGEGSDEILAGYDLDQFERRWDRIRNLQRFAGPLVQATAGFGRYVLPDEVHQKALKMSQLSLDKWNLADLPHITQYFDQREKVSLWPNSNHLPSDRILKEDYKSALSGDPLQQLLWVYQKSWLVEDLLMKADKATMAASLEARTPFLDYRLVEWANRQPNSVKINKLNGKGPKTKFVLRRFCKTRIPRTLLNRPKLGFPVPAYGWLENGLSGFALGVLTGPSTAIGSTFERNQIDSLIQNARLGDRDAQNRVWLLIILEIWLKKWKVTLN
jgi:asparagine synthase (glutamine-hydrolysing)